MSRAGLKFDHGKDRWDLLPWRAVREVVRVLTFGAQKYAPDGWRTVPDARRRYEAALERHLLDWRIGITTDKQSGVHHLAHAVCNGLFLLALEIEPTKRRKARRR